MSNYPTIPVCCEEIDTLFDELEKIYAIVWISTERVKLPDGTVLLAVVCRGTIPRQVKGAAPLQIVEELPRVGPCEMTGVMYRVLWRAMDWCIEHGLAVEPN